jgi:hypothetical protein
MAVSKEIATEEVNKWLDKKNVSQKRRETKKDSIESLISHVEDGIIVVGDDGVLTHKLTNPIEKEIKTLELTYQPRINVGKVQQHMNGVKSDDMIGMVIAYGAALTGKPKELIKALDTEDQAVLSTVVVFFM